MRNAMRINNWPGRPKVDVVMRNTRGPFAGGAADLAKRLWLLAVLTLWGVPSYADPAPAAPSYPAMAPVEQYRMADSPAEIALARSAAPASVSDKAEILVLGAHGYETAVKGTNGFVCYVGRSWENDISNAEFWNPKNRAPECVNAAAARLVSSLLSPAHPVGAVRRLKGRDGRADQGRDRREADHGTGSRRHVLHAIEAGISG